MATAGKLTRVGLVKHLVDRLGYTKKDATLLVNTFFRSMTEALLSGEGVELRGFGSFRVRSRAPRMGRNPRNGQPVHVPAKQVVYFKIGKEMRDKLAGPKEKEGGGGQAPQEPESHMEV